MNLNDLVQKYYTKENIVDMLTKYELYYQISLGYMVYETIQDIDETFKKLEDLNLTVNTATILSNIFELILHLSHHEDFDEKFEYHLRSRALLQSLKDFINTDKDLVNVDAYIKQKSEYIKNDTLFDENMKLQFESEYPAVHEHFDLMITENIAQQIQDNLK